VGHVRPTGLRIGRAVSVTGVMMRPEVQAAYERYAKSHQGDVSNIPELCEFMVNVGFRMCVEAMSTFNDLPAQLARVERSVRRIRELVDGMNP
jgi:hypothetical protein